MGASASQTKIQNNKKNPKKWESEKCRNQISDCDAFERFSGSHPQYISCDEKLGDNNGNQGAKHCRQINEKHRQASISQDRHVCVGLDIIAAREVQL